MESVSTSIDIASLKARALAPTAEQEHAHHGWSPNLDPTATTHQSLRHAFSLSPKNGEAAYPEPVGNDRDSTGLPSTVPESAPVTDASIIPVQAPQASPSWGRQRRMNSQGALDATQELSQSFYAELLSRSRLGNTTAGEETQQTLNEGDEGHIDITSSFVPQLEEDAEHRAFSPSQSQRHLSHFPESQRFKTPAAAGKKRDCNGNTKETPDLPRVPILRSDGRTPANVMGLSQLFDATQAATSPAIEPALNPLSDRPSPNLEVQNRPATASASSPLRPISEIRRATTEPASRYISVAQSQAERERRARLEFEAQDDDDSDDDFDTEPNIVRRQRILQERKARTDEQFRMLSSPTRVRPRGSSAIQSSPVIAAHRSSPSPAPGRRLSGPPGPPTRPAGVGDDVDTNASEAETEAEPEDDIDVNVRRSSQTSPPDDEDKENYAGQVQIPETTARLHRVVRSLPSQVEASPSLRHANGGAIAGINPPASSGPVAVANSQPSQSGRRSQVLKQNLKSSSISGVDFVPQSQTNGEEPIASPNQTQTSIFPSRQPDSRLNNTSTTNDRDEIMREDVDPLTLEQSSAPAQLATIPETDSAQLASNKQTIRSTNSAPGAHAVAASVFETAPTRQPPSSQARSKLSELSSPPIVTTPPGRKRKRVSEMSNEPTPTQPSTQGFDAAAALGVDRDTYPKFDESPLGRGKRQLKRRKVEGVSEEVGETASSTARTVHPALGLEQAQTGTAQTAMIIEQPAQAALPRPLSTIASPAPRMTRGSRTSLWDMGASPPQKQIQKKWTPRQPALNKATSKAAIPASTAPEKARTTRNAASSGKAQTQAIKETNTRATPTSQSSIPLVGRIVAPNNVFACFNGKSRAYYPARCLQAIEGTPPRYRIQWDGYDPDEVDAYGVSSLELRLGDQVKIDLKGFPKVSHVIHGFTDQVQGLELNNHLTDIRGNKTIVVAPKQRKVLPADISTNAVSEVPISAIYLDSNMWNQMKDRSYVYTHPRDISVSASGYATPLEMASTPSTPSSRNRRQTGAPKVPEIPSMTGGYFSNMAFAISYENSDRKTTLTNLMEQNGGKLISDNFMELLDADSMLPKSQYSHLGFAALIADKHSRKEKYMQALALGLPCLSGKWIDACVGADELVDWHPYLLAAGESDELEGATRSRLMDRMDTERVQLVDILKSRAMLLNQANVVIVMGRGKTEAKRRPYLFLIQALGAARVEQVTDLKAAKDFVRGSHDKFDWVFVEDIIVEVAKTELLGKGLKRKVSIIGGGCKVAGNELLVQSLIMGRLLSDETD